MKKQLLILVQSLLLILTPVFLLAQVKIISGKVVNAKDGSAIRGVTIIVKGAAGGIVTAEDGSFNINVPDNANYLVFSSIGFVAREMRIQESAMSVSLTPTDIALDEVVIVAYGSRKKSDLTGAVTSVTTKDFQKGAITSSEQLLQGKVAGLQVTTVSGSAGGGSKIRIRGGASLNASNDPLIVIDGMPIESNDIPGTPNFLNTINPVDIESISVLKDASAASLYGSRASNGVLIITTKKGVKGKVIFTYKTQFSVNHLAKKLDLLSAPELTAIINADAAATGNTTYQKLLGSANTDWQDQIYQSAAGYDNNIGISGSIKNIPFRLSAGYLNQGGILKTNNFNRLSSALNLSPKFFADHLTINLNVKVSTTGNRFADDGAVGAAVSFDPTQQVYEKNNYGGYFEWLQADNKAIDLATRNPLGLLEQRNNTSNVNRILGNLQLDYKLHFLPDLHVLVNAGIDNAHGTGNDNIDSLSATNYKTGGKRVFYEQGKKNKLLDISLSYSKELKKIHTKFDLLAGHSYQDFFFNVYNYPWLSYRTLADPSKPQKKDTIAGTETVFLTDKPEYRLDSYFGRANISILDQYLLTATIRRDASSKFSPATRVGYFPSVAAAWKLKDIFFKASNLLNDLKLRVGWGVTGQQDFKNFYSYLPRYLQSTSTAQYQFGNTFYSFLRPNAYDANIKWETTRATNIGLDFAFFDNRISGSLDVYQKKTKDLLSVIPVAPGSNFDITLLTNVGNMENKGLELTLNTTPVKTANWLWNFNFNISYNKSKITNLLKQPDANFKGIDVNSVGGGLTNYIGKYAVGYAPNVFYTYKQMYDPQTGAPVDGSFEDMNRDGKIDEADRYFNKKPAPDVLLGLNTQLAYKKWAMGLAGHASFGNYMYNQFNSNNGVLKALKNPLNFIENGSRSYLDTKFTGNNVNEYLSDYYIENASFFRLDNINLEYNAGRLLKDKATLRVIATLQNVFVITRYKGLDPESSSDGGVNFTIYPRPRIFSLGATLDF